MNVLYDRIPMSASDQFSSLRIKKMIQVTPRRTHFGFIPRALTAAPIKWTLVRVFRHDQYPDF
ncbi:hypothetical protein [Pseudomonas nitroreducens]|uniref:Uncharacterized protein n=1 Tax=Pseudomonas nitroreducens TaxID=46680 RepID=A0A6G6J859_PSENT|nr:hypothetical protein [Pseudomonas nitroreducens]QIE91393.1 hypothetical protein G5B91_34170 [Pseudomonas nitroreducens]